MRLGYWPEWCGWNFIIQTFKESTEFFWSRAAVSTYTAGGAFFLGLTSTPIQVAYYSAAEQLYKGAQSIFSPLSQALYPHMAKHQNLDLFLKILKSVIILSILGLLVGIYVGDFAIELIFGKDFSDCYPVLIIFMITFILTAPSTLLGYPFLGALGNSKAANLSVILAGLIQVVLLAFCYYADMRQATNIAVTVLIVELFVLIYRGWHARKTYKSLLSTHPLSPITENN
ncbi:hypothetical protein D9M70_461290 [compost metagenome]